MLGIAVLGAPEVTRDGAPVTFDTRKATAVLAYLAVTGRPSRRDALAALCWPDASRERAAASLRRTLSAARAVIGAEALAVSGGTVALAEGWRCDLVEARALAANRTEHGHSLDEVCERCVEPLSEAAALHRGPFLEGFFLRDSDAFEEWQFFIAEEVHRERSTVLERLAAARVLRGDLDGAIDATRRRLASDPLAEPAHAELIRLYAWSGRREAALRQYRECVRVLDRELGVAPLEETTALYQQVLEQRLPAPGAAPPPGPAPRVLRRALPRGRPKVERSALVGRDAEREQLVGELDGIRDDGRLIVVEGEAGVGKTRLVDEVLADPRLSGSTVLVGRCYEGETGLPYGLVAELLRSAAEAGAVGWTDRVPPEALAQGARLVPELAGARGGLPPVGPLDSPGAATRLADALGRILVAASSSDRPGILRLEDLHWADEASLDVLTHLLRRLRGRPVGVVATWRTELVPKASRLRRLVADLRRDDHVTALVLPRLGREAVALLVAPLRSDADVAARVHELTEGLPLLVVELVAALGADPDALDGPLPSGARELLETRLAGVSETARQVLAAAAVLGRDADDELLRSASGRSDDETAAALEELLERGLLAEALDGRMRYEFTHALLRTLAAEELSLARRRLLHRRAAAALMARAPRERAPGADAAVLARHLRLAGDDLAAAEHEALAGEHAAAVLADTQAITHYADALALGHPDPARLHEALGDLHLRSGRYAEALADYQSAAATGGGARAAALEHKLGEVHLRNGDWPAAAAHLEAALALLGTAPDDTARRARILADAGLVAHRQRRDDRAEALAAAALEAAELAGDRRALARALDLQGLLANARGDAQEAVRSLERALALAREASDVATEVAALNNLAHARLRMGDAEAALGASMAALSRAASLGDRHREAALHGNVADVYRTLGRNEDALASLKQAAAIFAEVGEAGVLAPEIYKLVEW